MPKDYYYKNAKTITNFETRIIEKRKKNQQFACHCNIFHRIFIFITAIFIIHFSSNVALQ